MTVNRRRSKRPSRPQATDGWHDTTAMQSQWCCCTPMARTIHPPDSSWSQQSHHIAEEHCPSPAIAAAAVSQCSKLPPFERAVAPETGAVWMLKGSARPPKNVKVCDARIEAFCTQRLPVGSVSATNSPIAYSTSATLRRPLGDNAAERAAWRSRTGMGMVGCAVLLGLLFLTRERSTYSPSIATLARRSNIWADWWLGAAVCNCQRRGRT